jgi:hypothetical protein
LSGVVFAIGWVDVIVGLVGLGCWMGRGVHSGCGFFQVLMGCLMYSCW